MAADFYMKQHDTDPPLPLTLTDVSGPIDLTNATEVLLLIKNSTLGLIVNHVLTPLNQTTNKGQCTYDWQTGDTSATGTYSIETQVTWADGGIQTFPASGYKTLSIVKDLGP